MSNRILDYPEATAITSDDYILLDNADTGAKCIKASALNINMDNYTIKEARGSIASFDDGEDLPLAFMGAYITAIQEGSGDPSPTNVRPILGFSGVEVGINDGNWWDEQYQIYGSGATARIGNKNPIPCKPNTTYYITKPPSNGWRFYDKDMNVLATYYNQTYTTLSNCYYMSFQLHENYGTTYNHDVCINTISIDYYTPYNGNTYSLTFTDGSNPLTVYGGYVDLISGVLTVDRGYDVYDGSNDEDWRHYGGNRVTVAVDDFTSPASGVTANIKCDKLKTISKSQQGGAEYVISGSDEGYHQFMVNVGISDITELRTWLSNNPITVVYELATPLTYQLSKQQIKSLVGVNNIFADTGDSIVDYRKLWVKPEM